MKKIFLMLIMSVVLFSSCEDFLTVTPQDSLVADNYYTSETALRANTASLYGKVWWDFHCQFMWLGGDELAGDLYYTYDQEGHYYYNKVGAGNSHSNTGWTGLYRVVSFANSIINDMPLPASNNGVSEDAINRAIAEARFMRATAYLFLTEYWGEVPIIENSTELITSGDPTAIYVNKNLQSNLYRFMCEDLEFAVEHLPETSEQPGRVTKWSAKGMLAKVYLTRAAYEKSGEYYTNAKTLAADVIENSGLALWSDYSTMFDVGANNSSESLFAIQCMKGEYGDGSSRNVNFSRGARIADQTWGAGKGPTISLQKLYTQGDSRRKWVYMTNGDYYQNLDKLNGGYTYKYSYRDPDNIDTQVESPNEMLSHIKKYVIGKATDCDGQVGLNQDAGNNIYVLRLSDVYMIYAEACMGTGNSTTDANALRYVNMIRHRANLADLVGTLTFETLIQERRKEFAFEGINWLDVKRFFYRDPEGAYAYLNGMKRDQIYKLNYETGYNNMTTAEKYIFENDKNNYVLSWQTLSNVDDNNSRVDNILFDRASMYIPIPAAVTTKAPILNEPAVDYYAK
ncbi:MAG: RagB/SusD family nutrient uptake outer membrane protein [Rikenellaceae bacterium]